MPGGRHPSSALLHRSWTAAGVSPDDTSLAPARRRHARHARRISADTRQWIRVVGRCAQLPRQSPLSRPGRGPAPLDVHHLPRRPLHPPDLALLRPRLSPLGHESRRLSPLEPPPPRRHRAGLLLPRPPPPPRRPAALHHPRRPPLGRRRGRPL